MSVLRASTLVGSLQFKTRYLIGTFNVEIFFGGLLRPRILSGPHTTFQ